MLCFNIFCAMVRRSKDGAAEGWNSGVQPDQRLPVFRTHHRSPAAPPVMGGFLWEEHGQDMSLYCLNSHGNQQANFTKDLMTMRPIQTRCWRVTSYFFPSSSAASCLKFISPCHCARAMRLWLAAYLSCNYRPQVTMATWSYDPNQLLHNHQWTANSY